MKLADGLSFTPEFVGEGRNTIVFVKIVIHLPFYLVNKLNILSEG